MSAALAFLALVILAAWGVALRRRASRRVAADDWARGMASLRRARKALR